MSEIERVPSQERFRVDELTSPRYEGLLSTALAPEERVGLACVGRINTEAFLRHDARGVEALMLLTDQRLLALRPLGKSLFGKVKEPEPIQIGFANIFRVGTMRAAPHQMAVEICGESVGGFPGPYIVWRLDFGSDSAPGYGDVWRVDIMDLAEAHGGTLNLPNGLR